MYIEIDETPSIHLYLVDSHHFVPKIQVPKNGRQGRVLQSWPFLWALLAARSLPPLFLVAATAPAFSFPRLAELGKSDAMRMAEKKHLRTDLWVTSFGCPKMKNFQIIIFLYYFTRIKIFLWVSKSMTLRIERAVINKPLVQTIVGVHPGVIPLISDMFAWQTF